MERKEIVPTWITLTEQKWVNLSERQRLVPQIEQEVAEYKRFRELTAEWIALSIEWSRLKIKHRRSTKSSN